MERSPGSFHRLCSVIVVSLFMVIGWVIEPLAAERQPLRVLLTNDDGFDAPGIKAVYEALVSAGHTVTLVAPLTNQSGSGARVTTRGTLNYVEHSAGIWSVDGSPADSVLVGLNHILNAEDPIDMVISGANFGQNLGYGSRSGTVGAATTAMYLGVPSIAVSVGINPSERDAEPVRFPSTLGAFEGAAELVLDVLDDLQVVSTDTGELLPQHTILNINYPAVSPAELKGVRIAQAARGDSGIRLAYEDSDQSGQLQVNFRFDTPSAIGRIDTDVELFFEGYATVSVLDGDWDAGSALREVMLRRLPGTVNQ